MKNLSFNIGACLVLISIFYFIIIYELVNIDNRTETFEGGLKSFYYESFYKCRNYNLTFDENEVRSLWKYKAYGRCEKSESEAYLEGDKLIVNCHDGEPLYAEDPGYPQRLGGMSISPKWAEFYSNNKKNEFVIVKCSEEKKDHFVFVFNRYKEFYSQNAFKRSLGFNKTIDKPVTVLMLVFDSVSRASAYMNWPKTMKYLKNIQSLGYNFIDFRNPTTTGINTRPNMIPIIYGQSEGDHIEYLQDAVYNSYWPSPKFEILQEQAIWSYYSKLGYTTMFLYDTIYDFLVKSFGRIIKTDHVFTNFWRMAYKVFRFSDFSEKQRCMGQEDSHYYSLSYTLQYLKNYKANNRFAYVHLDAAHENTGNVRTVDKDLVSFLKEITEWYKKNDQILAVFLIGDHGRINQRMQFNVKGFLDQKTPMTFLITSEIIAQKWKSLNILKNNENELVGRYDINLSLKDLAHFPYDRISESTYLEMKKQYPVSDVVSLFREHINPDRNCQDIGSTKLYCICQDYENTEETPKDVSVVKMLLELVKFTTNTIELNLSTCEKSKEFDVVDSKKFELDPYSRGWETIYKFRVRVNEENYLKGVANFCIYNRIKRKKNTLPIDQFPATVFEVNNTEVFLQFIELEVETGCMENYCLCNQRKIIDNSSFDY